MLLDHKTNINTVKKKKNTLSSSSCDVLRRPSRQIFSSQSINTNCTCSAIETDATRRALDRDGPVTRRNSQWEDLSFRHNIQTRRASSQTRILSGWKIKVTTHVHRQPLCGAVPSRPRLQKKRPTSEDSVTERCRLIAWCIQFDIINTTVRFRRRIGHPLQARFSNASLSHNHEQCSVTRTEVLAQKIKLTLLNFLWNVNSQSVLQSGVYSYVIMFTENK
jgi:hypothetical protein